ncbi:hypothetical protein [Nitratiruptor tergarcus]|uniref:Outer membrane protein beta-barrel domain-containing protein n=1 Tax=Nitratiruptor tergarcus DSM 16512 TaxID=1069081 RepID=A0A1W1WTS3_9BACT|nr:hypothetical protein [Nitratiruptor tergarcus]SMC09724.1 hypothetical protein SAMN05660197_1546 [Nitratiruptor tergarcus DSM 16512]
MKRLILFILAITSLFASSIEYGHGNFQMKYSLFNQNFSVDTDISTYSFVEEHKNIFSSDYYYRFNITWMAADQVTAMYKYMDTMVSPLHIATFAFEPKGLDISIGLGKNVYHKSEHDYLGIGLDTGVSMPYADCMIEAVNYIDIGDLMRTKKLFKVDVTTYKIGPHVTFSHAFTSMLSLYGAANYSFQSFRFKSGIIDSKVKVDGHTYGFDIGLRADLLHKNYRAKFITVKPRLYGVLGYHYQKWDVDSFYVRAFSFSLPLEFGDIEFRSSYMYLGIGYSF